MVAERSAPNFVTYTTAVQLRIKEIITQDLTRGVGRQTTFKKLKRVIETYGATIADENVRRKFEISLARGAVEIYNETVRRLESFASALAIPLVAVISIVSGTNTTNSQTPIVSDDNVVSCKMDREYLYEDRIDSPKVLQRVRAEIKRLMLDIADEEIKDRNGASLRNIAEIHVRHDYQQASIEKMRANGIKLVFPLARKVVQFGRNDWNDKHGCELSTVGSCN